MASPQIRPHWGDRILVHVLLAGLGFVGGMQINAAQVAEAEEKIDRAMEAVRIAHRQVDFATRCTQMEIASHE